MPNHSGLQEFYHNNRCSELFHNDTLATQYLPHSIRNSGIDFSKTRCRHRTTKSRRDFDDISRSISYIQS